MHTHIRTPTSHPHTDTAHTHTSHSPTPLSPPPPHTQTPLSLSNTHTHTHTHSHTPTPPHNHTHSHTHTHTHTHTHKTNHPHLTHLGFLLNMRSMRFRKSRLYLEGTGGYEPRMIFSTKLRMFPASNWTYVPGHKGWGKREGWYVHTMHF